MKIIIRPIQKNDNPKVSRMVREVLIDLGAPKKGTAYEDSALDKLFETYDKPRNEFFVVTEGNRILGCAGIAPLEDENDTICELQKMYFLPEVRGKGIGAEMMNTCLDFALKNGFTSCYLETLPFMKSAQKLYKKTGFEIISHRMGKTGHYSCNVWMLKKLTS